jgi:hypothetical protein
VQRRVNKAITGRSGEAPVSVTGAARGIKALSYTPFGDDFLYYPPANGVNIYRGFVPTLHVGLPGGQPFRLSFFPGQDHVVPRSKVFFPATAVAGGKTFILGSATAVVLNNFFVLGPATAVALNNFFVLGSATAVVLNNFFVLGSATAVFLNNFFV